MSSSSSSVATLAAAARARDVVAAGVTCSGVEASYSYLPMHGFALINVAVNCSSYIQYVVLLVDIGVDVKSGQLPCAQLSGVRAQVNSAWNFRSLLGTSSSYTMGAHGESQCIFVLR